MTHHEESNPDETTTTPRQAETRISQRHDCGRNTANSAITFIALISKIHHIAFVNRGKKKMKIIWWNAHKYRIQRRPLHRKPGSRGWDIEELLFIIVISIIIVSHSLSTSGWRLSLQYNIGLLRSLFSMPEPSMWIAVVSGLLLHSFSGSFVVLYFPLANSFVIVT